MIENTILPALGADQYTVICSPGGRILEVSAPLAQLLNADIVGRNLNDVMEDKAAAGIIRNSGADDVYEFECLINEYKFDGGSRISESGHIVMVLRLLIENKSVSESGMDLIRYVSMEMNRCAEGIGSSAVLMESGKKSERELGKATLRRNMMNLARIARNISARAEYESGRVLMVPRKADVFQDIRELFEKIRNICAAEADISFSCPEGSLDSIYDSTALGRIVLNLVGYCIRMAGDKASIRLNAEYADESLTISVSCTGRFGEDGRFTYGKNLELDVVSIFARRMHGSFISSSGSKGSTYRVTVPMNPCGEFDGFGLSNTILDWYGGMDRVEFELSGALSSESYL